MEDEHLIYKTICIIIELLSKQGFCKQYTNKKMSFANNCNYNKMLKKDKDVLVLNILSIGKSIYWGVINEKNIRFKYCRKNIVKFEES